MTLSVSPESITRRTLLKSGAAVSSTIALCSVLPRPILAQLDGTPKPIPPIEDPRIKAFVFRAIDAAKTAGADYADARLSHTIERKSDGGDSETLHVGVRALHDGYWGFASGPVWNADEVARLGREAVRQARQQTGEQRRVIDFVPTPVVPDGHWVMPVAIEPLTVHPLAIRDYLGGLSAEIQYHAPLGRGETVQGVQASCLFWVQERAFGATTGSYCTQRLYRTEGKVTVGVSRSRPGDVQSGGGQVDLLTPAGVGWELFRNQPVREAAFQLIEDIRADFDLPWKPVDVGRYDVVLDAFSVAPLISETIGAATQLDRALGYEANSAGTSYLTDPFAMLDTFSVGTSALTVTANRSAPGSVATVQWDDEGVAPTEFTLVERGVIRDYQTTREGAGWLKAGGVRRTQALVSKGCAFAPTAVDLPLAHNANLIMASESGTAGFAELIAGVPKGLAIRELKTEMDFQQLNGFSRGRTYEVREGKRVARIANAAVLFRTIELWKSATAFGGAPSARRFGLKASKGEPEQTSYHSVTTVPAVFKQLTVIEPKRRA